MDISGQQQQPAATKPWFCYLLDSPIGPTYVGSTVDLDRRLRQHNCEISGGAKATRVVCQTYGGPAWHRELHVCGFPSEGEALRFEWRWKALTKKQSRRLPPIERRFKALMALLALPKSTAAAMPFADYPAPLQIIKETDKSRAWFTTA